MSRHRYRHHSRRANQVLCPALRQHPSQRGSQRGSLRGSRRHSRVHGRHRSQQHSRLASRPLYQRHRNLPSNHQACLHPNQLGILPHSHHRSQRRSLLLGLQANQLLCPRVIPHHHHLYQRACRVYQLHSLPRGQRPCLQVNPRDNLRDSPSLVSHRFTQQLGRRSISIVRGRWHWINWSRMTVSCSTLKMKWMSQASKPSRMVRQMRIRFILDRISAQTGAFTSQTHSVLAMRSSFQQRLA